jgi:hypothetical protein
VEKTLFFLPVDLGSTHQSLLGYGRWDSSDLNLSNMAQDWRPSLGTHIVLDLGRKAAEKGGQKRHQLQSSSVKQQELPFSQSVSQQSVNQSDTLGTRRRHEYPESFAQAHQSLVGGLTEIPQSGLGIWDGDPGQGSK